MSLPQLGVPFVPSTMEEIRDAILTDYRLEALKTSSVDPAVQPGSDNWWWATSHAGIGMLGFSNIGLSVDAITPLNATGNDLEDWRVSLGLPEVKPSPSTGKIVLTVTGTSTVNDGEPLILPNGLRIAVVGTWPGVVDGDEIDVQAIDTGSATNLDGGTEVRFVSAPTNVNQTAKVSQGSPLRGGTDAETEDRKRLRILNAIANKPGGGNWADMRETALEALGSVQDCYVFPALGGPASVKVVPVPDFDPDNAVFTRALSTAALAIVRNAIFAKSPDGVEIVVEAAVNQSADVAIKVTLPSASLAGGNGQGWLDQAPWPPDATKVTVTGVAAGGGTITVDAASTTAPIPGQTHVMWWSPVDQRFRTFLVIGVGGSPGSRVLTLDKPAVAGDGTVVANGDYISPACVNAEAYGTSWVNAMRALGTGENTSDANRTPRALRHPYVADERPSSLSFVTLQNFRADHAEISDIDWAFRSATTPTVPGTVDVAVNILVPRHFGLYRM